MLNTVRRSSTPIHSAVFSCDGGHDALSLRRPQPLICMRQGACLPSLHQHYHAPQDRLTGNLRCSRGPSGPLCTMAPGLGVSQNYMDLDDSRFDGRQGIGGSGAGGGSGRFTGQIDNTPHGDSDITDVHYQNLLQSDPQNPLLLQNYAQFLLRVKHDLTKAEEYYERAILACPDDGRVLATYAELLWDAHRDSDRASMYFEQALKASPDDCYAMASYASFLWQSESEGNNIYSVPSPRQPHHFLTL